MAASRVYLGVECERCHERGETTVAERLPTGWVRTLDGRHERFLCFACAYDFALWVQLGPGSVTRIVAAEASV